MSQEQVLLLKKKFTISPKTAKLLIQAGYADYTRLADVSPAHVARQFGKQLGIPEKHISAYKRALRRIVWLGTKSDAETYVKDCANWSDKGLRKRGAWCEGFDDLTGWQIDELLGNKGGVKVKDEGELRDVMGRKEMVARRVVNGENEDVKMECMEKIGR